MFFNKKGGLAQLARAFAWHARGHRFDSDILHLQKLKNPRQVGFLVFVAPYRSRSFVRDLLLGPTKAKISL
jgi:hypothetical protein